MHVPMLTLAVMLASSATAWSQKLYVDAVNGSDLNPGTSPAAALRTTSRSARQRGERLTTAPFGRLAIGSIGVQRLPSVTIPPGADRATISIQIPQPSSMSGALWRAQALIASPASPNGAAFSNEAYIHIQ